MEQAQASKLSDAQDAQTASEKQLEAMSKRLELQLVKLSEVQAG